MRVYFDASVLIAALLSATGGSARLLEYVKLKAITGVASLTVIDEIKEEDKSIKLGKSAAEIDKFIARSRLLVRESITEEEIAPFKKMVDREDAHLIAGAKSARCKYLVTLDKKHLLQSDVKQKFLLLSTVSPKELLEIIVS